MTARRRWDVGLAAALGAGLLGVVAGSATVVAAGVVGLAFVAYGYATRPPDASVVLEREVSDLEPAPGARVDVEVAVRNAGDSPLAEVRVVDEPPSELSVVEGEPALATSLGPGEVETFAYAIRARRGGHAFGDANVLVRNVSGTVERERTVDLPDELTVRVGLEAMPLTAQTTPYDGRVDADAPGEGVAFHSVREFRPSDPLSRIDWKQFAKTNEFSTVQYQETRAATAVLLVDARRHVRVARDPSEHDAGEYCAFAAGRVAGVLLAASNRVGAALYGRRRYLGPAVGREQRLRVRRFLRDGLEGDGADGPSIFDVDEVFFGGDGGGPAAGSAGDPGHDAGGRPDVPVPDGGWGLSWLDDRMPSDAQVVFCTPLLDDRSAHAARQLAARGHGVTVVSPDVTTTETPGGIVARVERDGRVRDLRADLRVIEWSPDEPLAGAVDRATRRWGA